jgi:hypothetical protein
MMMTDVTKIARNYIDLWNERMPSRRREILATNWTSDARYVDPLMSGDGLDGVDALIAGVQQKFPDFKFSLIGKPNGFGDHVRFSWGLGPDGTDSPIKGSRRVESAASPASSTRCRRGRDGSPHGCPGHPGSRVAGIPTISGTFRPLPHPTPNTLLLVEP